MSKKGLVDYTGVILRFATAFGLSPRMRFDLSISEFVRDIYFRKELEIYDKDTWRPYCHVRDFARLLEIVIKSENEKVNFEIFNAGGNNNNATKKMLIDQIVKLIPDAKVKFLENGNDPRNYRVSFKKVEDVLGFVPKYSIEYGIEELINSLSLGLFNDSLENKDKYGNYVLTKTI